MAVESALLTWLLDTDPALRWQVQRDLAGEPAEVWGATRARVATEGFGARLLALQDEDGQWAGGAYFPGAAASAVAEGDANGDAEGDANEGQPWTATTWSLNALREWGVDAAELAGTAERLAANCRWEYDDRPYWSGEVDACINAYTLANGAWLGADVSGLVGWFHERRLPDGGWNCAWVDGSTRSSFHSTLNTVRGLLAHQQLTGSTELIEARHAGEEYLLKRRLTRRLSTGEPVGWWVDKLAYPFRWYYSVLHAADHFRSAALVDGAPPDPRLADAIEIIRADRQPDGRWLQGRRHPGQVWFEIDAPPGEPSPWLTFHALRVLDWWDGAQRA